VGPPTSTASATACAACQTIEGPRFALISGNRVRECKADDPRVAGGFWLRVSEMRGQKNMETFRGNSSLRWGAPRPNAVVRSRCEMQSRRRDGYRCFTEVARRSARWVTRDERESRACPIGQTACSWGRGDWPIVHHGRGPAGTGPGRRWLRRLRPVAQARKRQRWAVKCGHTKSSPVERRKGRQSIGRSSGSASGCPETVLRVLVDWGKRLRPRHRSQDVLRGCVEVTNGAFRLRARAPVLWMAWSCRRANEGRRVEKLAPAARKNVMRDSVRFETGRSPAELGWQVAEGVGIFGEITWWTPGWRRRLAADGRGQKSRPADQEQDCFGHRATVRASNVDPDTSRSQHGIDGRKRA